MKTAFTTTLMISLACAGQSYANNTNNFLGLDQKFSETAPDQRTGRWTVFAELESPLAQDIVVSAELDADQYTKVAALPKLEIEQTSELAPERVQFASYTRLPQLSTVEQVSSAPNFTYKTIRAPQSGVIDTSIEYSELSLTPAVKPKKRNLATLRKISVKPARYAGIPSRKTLARMPHATGGSEWACLTEALYFEARGESVSGIFAVAEVIVNRQKSRKFPNSVCGVIAQGAHRKNACQFSYKCDGINEVYREPKARAMVAKIAKIVLDKRAPLITGGATFYHANTVNPRWSRAFRRTATIGKHFFYRG